MKLRNKLSALLISVAAMGTAMPASAAMIAGWDFSQYLGAGLLSTDGAGPAPTLPANYSSLVPGPFKALAPEFLAQNPGVPDPDFVEYGRLYYDGQFGSTDIASTIDFTGTEAFNSFPGSLESNIAQPGPASPFDSINLLQDAGQDFFSPLSMSASQTLSVVFGIDTTLFGAPGAVDWAIDFGGKTLAGVANISIEFSTNGSTYAPVGSVQLTTTDTPFSVVLSPVESQQAFVRLTFTDATLANVPQIDNFGFSGTIIPEPGTALLLASGLVGLLVSGRRQA